MHVLMRGSMIALLLAAGAVSLSGQARPADDAIVPFKINVPDSVLRDLKERLARTRFPDQLPNVGWDYGTDPAYLKPLVEYWRDRFDWRAQERKLNEFDQFTTTIDGLRIHFIHQKSRVANAMPLALTHGWPGSIYEFHKVIGPLTDPVKYGGRAEDAFNVVAISLPGFGFSERPRDRGYSPEKMAGIIAKLMARLGYTRYGVQGGDWGGIISRIIALNDAQHVAGLHLNFCTAGAPAGVADPLDGVPAAEAALMNATNARMENERAYQQIQGTKPQTLGVGLTDSPAGLASWIVEKFHAWCDCGDDIESRFSKDDLLTNITIYWATETAASSTRIYYENRVAPPVQGRVAVPTACALFPREITTPPRKWVEARYNLVRWTPMPRGGHFAALEQPELLVNDVRAFFSTLR
ncbi:MAG TPA: alpha/beta fold hydrolase [Vicinamibacterales bacterium]|nr:alpha/beta fold hydrolase [Vicinamibacterales bacterium]